MPPKKKLNTSSSSKKPNPQPSKYGIQHFFDRHATQQQSQKLQSNNSTSQAVASDSLPPPGKPKDADAPSGASLQGSTPNDSVLPAVTDVTDNLSEVSPEISKSMSRKRFKFSPGMFIKQSQDDGADEVTWKISPVNERLQAVSKHTPKIIQALADSSMANMLLIQRCSEDKTSLDKGAKVEELLITPTPSASAKAPLSLSKLGLKKLNPDRDVDFNCNPTTLSNSSVSADRNPFRTPPSLSCRVDKLAKDAEHNGPSDQPFLRQHKKVLLELLDQVEDAIGVDNDTVCDKNTHSFKSQDAFANKLPVKVNHLAERTISHIPKEVVGVFSNSSYLVLEVSEKLQPAAEGPYKVLRLLNEQTGEERAVNLWDEWSYSVIAPGDTVNVIGQFDEGGNCDINHDNNFLIVHPDILVSGTRVAASFSCPRRTVLDERLKSNEHSSVALCGTLLHQIFQAGLTNDNPTIDFLECYTEVVLQRNVESLFACGVNEKDVRKTMIDAIPRIYSWIMLFRNMKEREDPNVNFGCVNGMKNVGISEASSNLLSCV
ncbi:DNA replication helicase [Trifolium repens]|nr:DNA replication helicase [Trifolium repens]